MLHIINICVIFSSQLRLGVHFLNGAHPSLLSVLAIRIQLCFAYSGEQDGCGPVSGLRHAGKKTKLN